MVFDNLAGRLYLITLVDPAIERAYARAEQRLDEWVEKLRAGRSLYAPIRPAVASTIEFVSGFTQAGFEAAVARIKAAFAGRGNAMFADYPGVGHGFNCWGRPNYNQKAAALAHGRTLEFLARHL